MIKLEPGQYVRIIFRNSMQMEGVIESWSEEESILVPPEGTDKFIIFHTEQDVLGVKVCQELPAKKKHKKFEEIVNQFKEVQETPSADDLRLQNLAQLKILMNEQEKKIISEKVRDHNISNVRQTQYGFPGITKKQSSK